MRKLILLARRRPELSRERYVDLLLRGHVPLVLRHQGALRGYVVNVVDSVHLPGSPELDSIEELSCDTLEGWHERLYDSPAGRAAVERSAAGLHGRMEIYACTEHVHKAPPTPPRLGERSPVVKMVAAVRRRSGLSHEEFVDHWLHRHAPLALVHHPALVKYVASVVDARLSESGAEVDGIAELHFASEEDLRSRLYGTEEDRRIIEADIPRFLGAMQAWIVSEYVEKRG